MRISLRGALCAVLCALCAFAMPSAAAVPTTSAPKAPTAPAQEEAPTVPLAERYRAVQHGGLVRAANSVITCAEPVSPGAGTCAEAQRGGDARNGQYEMTYIDVDDDPNTYNSSTAALELPEGSRVSYARLYWGGNLRVGEQKPAEDNRRVLFAEPGGQYKEVLADSVIGHRVTSDQDAYSASADVTGIVRGSLPGHYTVGQINVAMGHSAAGAWGGWSLVVAYENEDEPPRELALWDGFEPVSGARAGAGFTVTGLDVPPGADGHLGVVAYNGDRGLTGDAVTVTAPGGPVVALGDRSSPADDVMNSTIADLGVPVRDRMPAHDNTLGYESDVLDLSEALTRGAERLTFRFTTGGDSYHLGVAFLQADARTAAASGAR